MAKYIPIDMVKAYQGQICTHSDTYFQKRGDTLCTCKMCKPRNLKEKPYSEREVAIRDKFKRVRAAVKALTPEQVAQYKEDFERQLQYKHHKYHYLNGYIFAMEFKKDNG